MSVNNISGNIKTFKQSDGEEFNIQGVTKVDFIQIGDDVTASTITATDLLLEQHLYIGNIFIVDKSYLFLFRVGDAVTFDWSLSPNTDIRIALSGTSYCKVYDGDTAINTSNFTFDPTKVYCLKMKDHSEGQGQGTTERWQLYTMNDSSGGSTEALTTAQVNALLALI